MDELGHILREARETKGLSLTEVQDKIRINSRFLQALENGEYERLPTPVHVRGFLRNYARFLGLDPQPLLDRYELSRHHRPLPVAADKDGALSTTLSLADEQPFFDPVNMEVDGEARRNPESALRLVIILALIGFLYLLGNRFVPLLLGNGDGTEALTEGVTAAIQNIASGQNEAVDSEPLEGTAVVPSGVITSTSRNNFDMVASATSSSPTPTRPLLPATMETIHLELEITERAWMEVTIDGDVVFSGIAVKDDTFEWEAQEEAKILTGNAIGVFVTINDIPLGRLGSRGESKEEIWQTTN